jgi:hypothetical protein
MIFVLQVSSLLFSGSPPKISFGVFGAFWIIRWCHFSRSYAHFVSYLGSIIPTHDNIRFFS